LIAAAFALDASGLAARQFAANHSDGISSERPA